MKKLKKSYNTLVLFKITKNEVKNIKKLLKKGKNILITSKCDYDMFGEIKSYLLLDGKIKINNCNVFTNFALLCNQEKFIDYLIKMENTVLISESEKFVFLVDSKNTFYIEKKFL